MNNRQVVGTSGTMEGISRVKVDVVGDKEV